MTSPKVCFARRGALPRAVSSVLLVSLPLSGCYTLAPLPAADPSPSSRVLVRLTDQGTVDLAPSLGPGAAAVDGTVEAVRGDTLDLLVRTVELRGGGFTTRPGDYVAVPRPAIGGVEERRLDRRRSWLLGGAIVVGAAVLGRALGTSGILPGPDGGTGGIPVQ